MSIEPSRVARAKESLIKMGTSVSRFEFVFKIQIKTLKCQGLIDSTSWLIANIHSELGQLTFCGFLSFEGFVWNHVDQVWRHYCFGVRQVANFPSVLLPDVLGYRTDRSFSRTHLLAGPSVIYWLVNFVMLVMSF